MCALSQEHVACETMILVCACMCVCVCLAKEFWYSNAPFLNPTQPQSSESEGQIADENMPKHAVAEVKGELKIGFETHSRKSLQVSLQEADQKRKEREASIMIQEIDFRLEQLKADEAKLLAERRVYAPSLKRKCDSEGEGEHQGQQGQDDVGEQLLALKQ